MTKMSDLHDGGDPISEALAHTGLADDTEADIAAELEATVTEAGEDKGEGDGDVESDVRAEIEAQGNALAEAEATQKSAADWDTEFNQLVEPYKAELEAAGLKREDAVRRLFEAERVLRQDPSTGLSWLAANYSKTLPPEQRAEIAVRTLHALGFPEGVDGLQSNERAELQAYREQRSAQARSWQEALPRAQQQIEQFARTAPHLETVRNTMSALMQAGEASDLASAYRMACQLRGLPTNAETAEQQRRAALEKAKRASTPRTGSVRGAPAPDDDGGDDGGNIEATLRAQYERVTTNGRARI